MAEEFVKVCKARGVKETVIFGGIYPGAYFNVYPDSSTTSFKIQRVRAYSHCSRCGAFRQPGRSDSKGSRSSHRIGSMEGEGLYLPPQMAELVVMLALGSSESMPCLLLGGTYDSHRYNDIAIG